ncbi:thioesterase-like superfamily-domain-containing protein [Peziza echinospora]|nr:thioesterase-like superfamily-domain-containing protein [Peziza echinospora]
MSNTTTTTTPPHLTKQQRSSIIKSLPPTLTNLTRIEQYAHLTPLPEIAPNIFTNTFPLWHPPGARGIYGGCVIAQSLVAATKTVPADLWLHSCHSYFVVAGNASLPITYHVEDIRTGRSFATREVKAKQKGKPIFVMTASFQKTVRKPGVTDEQLLESRGPVAAHQIAFPKNVPEPLSCVSDQEKVEKLQEQISALEKQIAVKREARDDSYVQDEEMCDEGRMVIASLRNRIVNDPFEWRKIFGSPGSFSPTTSIPERKVWHWVRSRELLGDRTETTSQLHLIALSYFSDAWFIGTVTRVNPKSSTRNLGMMVSLDHTIYFHCGEETKVDGDEWLLVEMDSPWMGEERALVTQRVWRKSDGKLLATCVQEGLVRLKDGRVDATGDAEASPPKKGKTSKL